MKKTPPLKEYDLDTDAYDTFIVGSPVWAWTYSPPLRTFFSQNDIEGKNVVVFCCHEGGMGNTLKEMEMAMKWNKFLAEADFNVITSYSIHYTKLYECGQNSCSKSNCKRS